MTDDEKQKQRTLLQNRALHLWFSQIAEMLNDAGFEQKITIGTMDVPWSEVSVKWMFKKISAAQFDKIHTADLTTKELTQVSETLTRVMAQKGIDPVPFPSIESLLIQQEEILQKRNTKGKKK